MKNNLFTLSSISLLVVFCLTSFTPSYDSTDKSKLLVGKWTLIDFKTPTLENNFKASGMTPQKRKQLMDEYVAGSYIEFRADGTYEVSILGSDPEVKHWKLNPDDTRLIVQKNPQTPTDEIELETLTKKELVIILSPKNSEYVQMFFIANNPESK
jgi:hypothetical protein